MLLVQEKLQRSLLVILGSHLQLQACQLGLVQLHPRLRLCLLTSTHSYEGRTGLGRGGKQCSAAQLYVAYRTEADP